MNARMALLLLAGCVYGGGGQPLQASLPDLRPWETPLGSSHAEKAGKPSDNEPPPLLEVPDVLVQLTETVRALDTRGRADHADIIAALTAFRDALPVIIAIDKLSRERIDQAIVQLRVLPRVATHSPEVRTALEVLAMVLLRAKPRVNEDLEKYSAAVDRFGEDVRKVDRERPLLAQQRTAVVALRAGTRALYVGVGLPPPVFYRLPGEDMRTTSVRR